MATLFLLFFGLRTQVVVGDFSNKSIFTQKATTTRLGKKIIQEEKLEVTKVRTFWGTGWSRIAVFLTRISQTSKGLTLTLGYKHTHTHTHTHRCLRPKPPRSYYNLLHGRTGRVWMSTKKLTQTLRLMQSLKPVIIH